MIRHAFFRFLSGLLGIALFWGFVASITASEKIEVGPVGALVFIIPFALIAYAVGGQKLLRKIAPSIAEKKDE